MSDRTDKQRKTYEFFRQKFETNEAFTKAELFAATGFSESTLKAYAGKQFKTLWRTMPDGKFKIRGAFRQFRNWDEFRVRVVTQNRNFARKYVAQSYAGVTVFEFFMPLRNEEALRGTLDSLFFKDSVIARFKDAEADVSNVFPLKTDETRTEYFDRLSKSVSEKFGGYSIHHVSGRFRVSKLKTKAEVFSSGSVLPDRYLIDETTAIVRFIVPLGHGISAEQSLTADRAILTTQADQIWGIFRILFVESILELVNAEDEVWLMESGLRNRLHVWTAKE